MSEYFELRITRYNDSSSFERIVDLLGQLFPDRSRDELASGLAVTPVQLTHRATALAASELKAALDELGASVVVRAVDDADSGDGTVEVADDFMVRRQQPRRSATTPAPSSSVKPPWEAD